MVRNRRPYASTDFHVLSNESGLVGKAQIFQGCLRTLIFTVIFTLVFIDKSYDKALAQRSRFAGFSQTSGAFERGAPIFRGMRERSTTTATTTVNDWDSAPRNP